MILYAMLPNMEHPTFEAREFGTPVAQSILDSLNNGPVWGYLTEWDMGRLQGMVDTGCLMHGNITLRADPDNLGMLRVAYGDFSLYGVFERKEHDANFLFTFSRGMVPRIRHLNTLTLPEGVESPFVWKTDKGVTMIAKFGKDGQPIDIPCAYEEPKVPPTDAG